MTRKALTAVAFGVLVCVCEPPARAQTKGAGSYMARLVPAQCLSGGTPMSCNVSGITFGRGQVKLSNLKQSQLTVSTSIGSVGLQEVTPAQERLDARLSAVLSYGPDPDANCPLAKTQVVATPWATSSMVCLPGFSLFTTGCRGELHLTSLAPPECSDVDVIVEDFSVEVYESGFAGDSTRLIARDGQAIGGRSPDCDSGGSGGCP